MNDDLRQLAVDLGKVDKKMQREVNAVVKKAAVNVKNTMREDFQRSRHFAPIGSSINFDIVEDAEGIEAQIGPDKQYRAGRLANIAYFGSSRGGGGTVDVENGLRKEEPNFYQYMRQVVGDVL